MFKHVHTEKPTIYNLAALLKKDFQGPQFSHAKRIKEIAVALIEPYILGIPKPNLNSLRLVQANPAIPREPASFAKIGDEKQPTIYIANIVHMMAILSKHIPDLTPVSKDTLWIMMAIVFCHEMVHAWQAYGCAAASVYNKCNSQTFATFVTNAMATAEGVSDINKMGVDIMKTIVASMQVRGLPTISLAMYQKCNVKASETIKQDLRQMTCSILAGPDVEYGGRRQKFLTPRTKIRRSVTPKTRIRRSVTPKQSNKRK